MFRIKLIHFGPKKHVVYHHSQNFIVHCACQLKKKIEKELFEHTIQNIPPLSVSRYTGHPRSPN